MLRMQVSVNNLLTGIFPKLLKPAIFVFASNVTKRLQSEREHISGTSYDHCGTNQRFQQLVRGQHNFMESGKGFIYRPRSFGNKFGTFRFRESSNGLKQYNMQGTKYLVKDHNLCEEGHHQGARGVLEARCI